ncbi:MAG: hypothetical protein QNK05_16480 [Myxococcota bacterium]|nr:hypothetical protein [Myxococcota bacterium]
MRSLLRLVPSALLLVTLGVASPGFATSTGPERPSPPPDVVDCALDADKTTCIECGSGGIIACCWDDHCDVKNKPPKTIYVPPRSPYGPSLPGWGWMSWEIL